MRNKERIINGAITHYYKGYLRELERVRTSPFQFQREVFNWLLRCGRYTKFGVEKRFENIRTIEQFRRTIPVSTYNDIAPYVERIRRGEDFVLWNQRVRWFAKSSGTSSAVSKFIPVTPDSLKINHFGGMRRMLVNYIQNYPNSRIFSSKALTLGGSVAPDMLHTNGKGKTYCGDLSAVMLSASPAIVEFFRTPSRSVALIGDFEKKVDLICRECTKKNVSNFSGVPSWNLILMGKVLEFTGKKNLLEVWPNMELFMHGGTRFEQYRALYQKLIPSTDMHYLENYNASEGYFAFQDDLSEEGMLLMVNCGVFYEFVPLEKLQATLGGDSSCVVTLEGVEKGIDYAIIITTCGGLWRYLIEDCVRFTSVKPYKIIVSGRTRMFINAFGEELMIDNAERALAATCDEMRCNVSEFTVAPDFMSIKEGSVTKGRHLWVIEFSKESDSLVHEKGFLEKFTAVLDRQLRKCNSDYDAKRSNDSTMILPKVKVVAPGTFLKWMSARGKVGGQNKIPRLWCDRTFTDQLVSIGRG